MGISEQALDAETYVIALAGRMDIQGIAEVETRFAGMTAAPRMRIVVDLAEVPFMASIGIRALIMNAKAVERRGGRICLAAPQPQVHEVLVTSGVDGIVPICATRDEALASVRA